MNFLVDAQVPRSVADMLREHGHDVLHTLDLPLQNRTSDNDIRNRCADEDRILISKDKDFLNSHMLRNKPSRLVLIKTGNIQNTQLLEILTTNIFLLCQLLEEHSLIEVHKHEMVVRPIE